MHPGGAAPVTMTVLLPDEAPAGRWCKAGHVAAPDARFIAVGGAGVGAALRGVYCEPCIAKVNDLAARTRELRRLTGG